MPEFKDMLKYFRMREKLSQSELAEKLGVSTSRISMYEAGRREPDFETEEKIADFFNTDLNTLRGRDSELGSLSYYFSNTNGNEPDVELTFSRSSATHLQKYFNALFSDIRKLNDRGREEATKRIHELTYFPEYTDATTSVAPVQLLNAAHADSDATEEDRKHDEDIMDDDSKWGD